MTGAVSIAAVHEAGHAVASVDFGQPFRGVRVHRRRVGSGITYGTGRTVNLLNLPDDALWGRVVGLLAGGYAEARYRRRGSYFVFLTSAADDYQRFNQHKVALAIRIIPVVMMAAGLQTAGAEEFKECEALAVDLAHSFARDFVRKRWPAILTVAAALDDAGFLTVGDVRRIVEGEAAQ